jgi:hypothetical protein
VSFCLAFVVGYIPIEVTCDLVIHGFSRSYSYICVRGIRTKVPGNFRYSRHSELEFGAFWGVCLSWQGTMYMEELLMQLQIANRIIYNV